MLCSPTPLAEASSFVPTSQRECRPSRLASWVCVNFAHHRKVRFSTCVSLTHLPESQCTMKTTALSLPKEGHKVGGPCDRPVFPHGPGERRNGFCKVAQANPSFITQKKEHTTRQRESPRLCLGRRVHELVSGLPRSQFSEAVTDAIVRSAVSGSSKSSRRRGVS